jgi:3-oxoacyl-[acyl-carrier-protein] synthase II
MDQAPMKRRVVVTGMGTVTPQGPKVKETFQRAKRGESGIENIKQFDTRGLPVEIGGEVDPAWIRQPPGEKAARLEKIAPRNVQLMWTAAEEATTEAKLHEVSDRDRIGVLLGCHGTTPSLNEVKQAWRAWEGDNRWNFSTLRRSGYNCLGFLKRKADIGPAVIANVFDCRGPNMAVASACAAGGQAIGESYRLIRDGRADLMLAGGCEGSLSYVGITGFILLKALAERYSSPKTASRPFDRKRNGFVMSDGAGAVVLEELGHARARGASILGELLGYGDSTDAYRITDIHPQADGAVLAMTRAIEDAGIEREEVEYINAHGTSTTQNDALETLAIKRVFGERAKTIPVSSNKSMLGHTIGAAGAIELILTLAGMRESIVLPTINYETPDPKCDLDYVPNKARPLRHRVALSNSFGFGGQNAALCIGRSS